MTNNENSLKVADDDKAAFEELLRSLLSSNTDISGAGAIRYDGLILASKLPVACGVDVVTEFSLKAFESAQRMLDQMNFGRLDAMMSVTQQGY